MQDTVWLCGSATTVSFDNAQYVPHKLDLLPPWRDVTMNF